MKWLLTIWRFFLRIPPGEPTVLPEPEPMPPEQPIQVPDSLPAPKISNRERLLAAAKSYEGVDASPWDRASDEQGCAESCSLVIRDVFADFPIVLSTRTLFKNLSKDKRFKGTLEAKPGNVVISVTGTGNGSLQGHTGILGDDLRIFNNNSFKGIWERNYTLDTWVKRYRTQGGMKVYIFEPVG